MDRLPSFILAMMFLILVGCSTFGGPEDTYLWTAQNRVNQEQVKQRLGPPITFLSGEVGRCGVLVERQNVFARVRRSSGNPPGSRTITDYDTMDSHFARARRRGVVLKG